jgi:hypothetical protein
MAATIGLPDGTPPWVNTDTISAASPSDVWFSWALVNSGDEDGNTNGFYFTVQDPSGTYVSSDFAPEQDIAVGVTIEQGARIEATQFSAGAGTYWAMLRDPTGSELGGASILVTD